VDFGASARIAGATLGGTVQNLGPNMSFGGGSYPLPQLVRFGISRPFFSERILLAADYTMPKTYFNDLRVGAEVRPNSVIAVRMGYRRVEGTIDDPSTGLSFGLGAHYGPLNLDYAMTPDNGFSDIHRLSFGYTFGGSEPKPEPKKPEPQTQPAKPTVPKVIAAAPAPAPKKAAPEPKAPAEAKPSTVAGSELAQGPSASPKPAPAPAPKKAAPEQYEVVLGSYQTESSAQAELKALRILGFGLKDATIVPGPNGGYRLSLVRFNSRKSADELAASLVKMSFTPRIELSRR
jgi:hypothetical protein